MNRSRRSRGHCSGKLADWPSWPAGDCSSPTAEGPGPLRGIPDTGRCCIQDGVENLAREVGGGVVVRDGAGSFGRDLRVAPCPAVVRDDKSFGKLTLRIAALLTTAVRSRR